MGDEIVRVNMSTLRATVEPMPAAWAGLGGRGLTSTIVAAEVPPTCDPLGPRNKLVFAPGLLSGTPAASSGRLSAGAKSPLTGTIKESNAGGTSAQVLARLGVRALIIEGRPAEDRWYSLHLCKDGVSIREERELVGLGNFAVVEALEGRLSERIGVIGIGPAGELKMNLANISVRDPGGKIRSHGRGGLGAVMGSKRIKFITLDPDGAPPVQLADPSRFSAAAEVFANALTTHRVSGEALPAYGTTVLVDILNEAGGLPTRNFRVGQLDAHESISGERLQEAMLARGTRRTGQGCHTGCIIQCSKVFVDKDGRYVTSGFEFPTVSGFGANCCIEDLSEIARLDSLMDDIGCDSIETAVTFAVAMEAGVLRFGDGGRAIELLDEDIRRGTPLGRLLGGGAAMVGKLHGLTRIPVVKGQGIPGYDPRAVKGIGVTYCTSTMGADHTSGYSVALNILRIGGYLDPLDKEGQVELSRRLQISTAAVDSTGLCMFTAFPALEIPECLPAIVDMIRGRFGIDLEIEEVQALGKYILKTEHEFNMRAGFTRAHDRLPEFFEREPLPPHGVVWDFTPEEIDAFWDF
jgi:aldehyde:ferredoxin oxidoreductase